VAESVSARGPSWFIDTVFPLGPRKMGGWVALGGLSYEGMDPSLRVPPS
jgi:hypothetical protein